jgi:hypothetical protein
MGVAIRVSVENTGSQRSIQGRTQDKDIQKAQDLAATLKD